MRIVKFSNGKYGLRKGFLGLYWFYDFNAGPHNYWWFRWNKYFKRGDCQSDERNVRRVYDDLNQPRVKNDVGTPVDALDLHIMKVNVKKKSEILTEADKEVEESLKRMGVE